LAVALQAQDRVDALLRDVIGLRQQFQPPAQQQ
jgi:hypothetical protein